MAYPANTQRNKEILQKRKKGWSFRKIAKHYGINHTRVYQIYKQEAFRVVDK